MAHFDDLRLPEDFEVGAVYGPEFETEISPMQSGREKRNRVRDPLCVGDLSYAPRLEADYPELLKFFRLMNGRWNSFRFRDASDYVCAASEGAVIGLTGSTFQLVKVYAVGSHAEQRVIQAPLAAGFVLEESGVALTLTTDYTLDTATGIVTTVAPKTAADLTWSGEFDNVVRFDTDRMAARYDANQILSWGGIPIKEVAL